MHIRERGRLQRKFMNVVKMGMQRVDVTEEDASDSVRWRQMICRGDS